MSYRISCPYCYKEISVKRKAKMVSNSRLDDPKLVINTKRLIKKGEQATL